MVSCLGGMAEPVVCMQADSSPKTISSRHCVVFSLVRTVK